VHIEFAEKHSASGFEAAYGLGISGGNTIFEYATCCGGAHSGSVYQIF
jgi:hypothetical protein